MKWQNNGGGDFEQPPVGTHVARCIKVIDIGTQKGEYQGQATSKRQCIIGFELPDELMTTGDYAGKPFTVSKFYTASLHEKSTLRKDLANWRGRDFTEQELAGFESKNIIDKTCLLSLTANDKGRTKITGVMALPKGSQVGARVNDITYFSLDDFNQEAFDSLGDGIKKLIMQSPEYRIATNPQHAPASGRTFDDIVDDIPF